MSQRYDEEQQQLKKDIEELQRQCDKENDRAFCKEQFLKAVRKFMEMKTLTPTILHELVERIDVYQTQGRGKNRTQRIVIHYNFIGVLDLLSAPIQFCSFSPNRKCRKMAGKGVQPLNNYTCRFRPSSLKQADKSGLDGLQTGK